MEEQDFLLQTQFFGERYPGGFHIAIAVNVKLGVGELGGDFLKSTDRDVQALVPLQAPWKDHLEFAVPAVARKGTKDRSVNVVDEHGALVLRPCAR